MTTMQEALSWALFHFLWQGVAVALVLAAGLWFCRTARVRYLLACGAMAAMVLAFAITLAIYWPASGKMTTGAAHVTLHLAPRPEGKNAGGIDGLREPGPPAWFVPVWLSGVSLFYCYSLIAWMAATRLKRRGAFPAPVEWRERLRHLAARLGLRHTVALMESCLTEVPVAIGYLRPVILLPLGMLAGLGAEQVEAVLIHELAHIRRYDYLINVMQTLVEGLLFYHPAVWWVGSVMRSEREHCCDDVVVALQGDARGYAATLARLELNRGGVREPVLAATGGNLMKRIHRLMQQPEGPRMAAPLISAGVLLVTASLLVAAWQTPTQPPLPQRKNGPAPVVVAGQQDNTAQPAVATAQTPAPLERRQKLLSDPLIESPFKKWLNEDVAYIIMDAERTAYKGLQTDEEREHFIEQFWTVRDPTPGTIENEYKQEHYRRIAFANEHYAAKDGLPGWKTDRGRIYITYGPPDEIEDHAAGGAYQRPAAEGGGTTTTFPFQQWRYKFIDGLGSNIIVEFVDPTMSGEFRMTADPNEKDALRYVQPAGRGQANNEFARLQQFARLQTAPPPALPLTVTVNVIPGPNVGVRMVSFSVPIEMSGHTTKVLGRIIKVSMFTEELDGLSGLYTRQLTLVPGSYQAEFIVKDAVTGVVHRGLQTFDVK